MTGRIQSIQSFSTLDGPGTRCVVFLQGCKAGCLFCHNPDSWDMNGGKEIHIDDLMRRLQRFKPFLKNSGLTISGGEPLLQPDFTIELAKRAKSKGWHVALDTSGWASLNDFKQVVAHVDLVMLSIKHPITPEKLSKINLNKIKINLDYLTTINTPVRIRYVLIPNWSDEKDALEELKRMIHKFPNLEMIEILPYNRLACDKWVKLGWENQLIKNTEAVNEKLIHEVELFFKQK